MIWEPFALALLFGLAISAGIYFVFFWPAREPDEDAAAPSRDSPERAPR